MHPEAEVYRGQADLYERLVSREDYQGNILRALAEISHVDGLDVADLGAGTGRLACLLAPRARSVLACDVSTHMLAVAARKFSQEGYRNCSAAAADHRRLPLPRESVDLAISGWSLAYLKVWGDAGWRQEVLLALAEMQRVLRRRGKIIILETLGTGHEQPHRPKELEEYYQLLEVFDFQMHWVRTDYQFEDLDEAQDLAGFFFGEEMRRRVAENRWTILPECTGIWWQDKHSE